MITRDFLKTVRADLDTTLVEFGRNHGLTIEVGKITFLDESFKVTLNATLVGGETPEAHLLKVYDFGFKAGQEVTFNRPSGTETLTILGAKRGGTIILGDNKGGRYTAKVDAVKRALARMALKSGIAAIKEDM